MWSSQHYRETGRGLGIEEGLVERAATAIEAFIDAQANLPPLLTLGHLGQRTNVSWYYLNQLVSGSREKAYTYFRIRKRS